jgi:DNA-binding transcriptional regulator YdaS (Cro superfamily)
MSLRQQAKILGISPTYLSLMVNGKRKWQPEIKARYEKIVNTLPKSVYKSSQTELGGHAF